MTHCEYHFDVFWHIFLVSCRHQRGNYGDEFKDNWKDFVMQWASFIELLWASRIFFLRFSSLFTCIKYQPQNEKRKGVDYVFCNRGFTLYNIPQRTLNLQNFSTTQCAITFDCFLLKRANRWGEFTCLSRVENPFRALHQYFKIFSVSKNFNIIWMWFRKSELCSYEFIESIKLRGKNT